MLSGLPAAGPQPLPYLPVSLGRHRAGIEHVRISVVARPNHLKAVRLERQGKFLEFSLVQLASERMERNAGRI
jgi:hypothetical protein